MVGTLVRDVLKELIEYVSISGVDLDAIETRSHCVLSNVSVVLHIFLDFLQSEVSVFREERLVGNVPSKINGRGVPSRPSSFISEAETYGYGPSSSRIFGVAARPRAQSWQ